MKKEKKKKESMCFGSCDSVGIVWIWEWRYIAVNKVPKESTWNMT